MTEPDPLALAAMVAYCGWDPTVPVTETVTLDGTGTRLIQLPSMHVTAVSAISVTDQWGTVTTPTIGTGVNEVGWSEDGSLVWSGCGVWPAGQGNIAVTYQGGYYPTPDDLDAALQSLSRRTAALNGVTSKRLGSAAVAYSSTIAEGGLLLVEQMVFDRYRIIRAA